MQGDRGDEDGIAISFLLNKLPIVQQENFERKKRPSNKCVNKILKMAITRGKQTF
jgi:hypothetical protein